MNGEAMRREQGPGMRTGEAVFAALDEWMEALGWEFSAGLQVVDGGVLAERHYPDVDPARPALVRNLGSRERLARIARCLELQYAEGHRVRLLGPGGNPGLDLLLGAIQTGDAEEASPGIDPELPSTLAGWVLAVPAWFGAGSMLDLAEVIAHLRAPDGCPWDREQTHRSLRPYLIEEAYETVEAIDRGAMDVLAEELGDLLLQVVLHAQVAVEAGDFRLVEVIQAIHDKLLRRHPHVFGTVEAETAEQVLVNWEQLKRAEREEKGGPESPFAGIPTAMPALARAEAALKKARRIEALREVVDACSADATGEDTGQAIGTRVPRDEEALGKRLMALCAAALDAGLDAEGALREQVTRFIAQAEAHAGLAGPK